MTFVSLRSGHTLGDIIRVFKSISAIKINGILGRTGISLWQRNYYEHIIRNEKELNQIREYTQNNPLQWRLDRENSVRTGIESLEDEILGNTL